MQIFLSHVNPQFIEVKAYARLHFGFFDMSGLLGRRFGSLGLSIDAPVTEVKVHIINDYPEAENVAKNDENACKIIQNFVKEFNLPFDFKVEVVQKIPQHAGLGSGTQMALAIGSAINQLCGLGLSIAQVASVTQRGTRSGIGVATFEHGGLVVDGGRGALTKVPPMIARADFPEHWRILLIMDSAIIGTHGEQELAAFKQLPNADITIAQQLSHRILMQALPSVAEADFAGFSQSIRALQDATGAYFSSAQGGQYFSQNVTKVLKFLQQNDVKNFGQTSWGPTGFAIFEHEFLAIEAINALKHEFKHVDSLSYYVVKAVNHGAVHTS